MYWLILIDDSYVETQDLVISEIPPSVEFVEEWRDCIE